MIESKVCLECGDAFARKTSRDNTWKLQKFCGRKCYHRYHTRKYERSDKGKATKQRYYRTPSGRTARLRSYRGWACAEIAHHMLLVEYQPCRLCGEANVELLQVDHVIPRGLGGCGTRENLQVLCIFHHMIKTRTDLVAIRLAHPSAGAV